MPDFNKIMTSVAEELNLEDKELETEEETELEEDEEVEEEVLDGEVEEETNEEETEEEETEDEEEVVQTKLGVTGEEEFTPKTKITAEEKQRFAFEKLRKEAKEKAEELQKLEEVAKAYGFNTYKEMMSKLEKDVSDKKAKEMGVDPKFYEDLQNTKKQLEQLKREREEETSRTKINTFVSRLNEFSKENNLTEEDKQALINSLDEDGFTVESLYNVKNYKKLFSGYVSDKIIEQKKQQEIEKLSKKKNLEEKRMTTGNGTGDKVSLDQLVELAMKRRSTY